jgi:transposase
LEPIGVDISEHYDYVPTALVVVEYNLMKYACKNCKENVVCAKMPKRPIKGGLPEAGLLSYVAVSKYKDHLPLYRLQDIFKRQGVEIARSTMCDWIRELSHLVEPIYNEIKKDVLAEGRQGRG